MNTPSLPANDLQFRSILVVAPNEISAQTAWRTEGLHKAAVYTGLELHTPHQPEWTESEIAAIKSKSVQMSRGYALSFLGHLNALREAAKQSTTLVIEDDVDWDIGLRAQMPQIAEAVRNLTNSWHGAEEVFYPPFGKEWDILWLGHCGDSIPYGSENAIEIEDPTVPPYINSWETRISPNPNHTRWIHRSTGPICTYAYAVTDEGARKILERDDHGTENYDVWLHIRCKSGEFRCITVNPELFHHHQLAGAKSSLISEGGADEAVEKERTANIWHSARCNSASGSDAVVTCMGPEPKPD